MIAIQGWIQGESWGGAPPSPLGSLRTCLAPSVYRIHIFFQTKLISGDEAWRTTIKGKLVLISKRKRAGQRELHIGKVSS